MTQITDEMKVAAVKAYTEVDGKCRPAAMQKALEAALPFLPIAVEGKVKALEWLGPRDNEDGEDTFDAYSTVGHYIATEKGWFIIGQTGWNISNNPKAAAQADFERRILSALISSPGKDGGQEVEAVAWRYKVKGEYGWSDWCLVKEVAFLEEYKRDKPSNIVIEPLYSQPASTALVDAPSPQSKVDADRLRDLIRWAHETLYEINPSNYDHDEVCKLNDASVEVILGLAVELGEKHGKSDDWWAERLKAKSPSSDRAASVGIRDEPWVREEDRAKQDAARSKCDNQRG